MNNTTPNSPNRLTLITLLFCFSASLTSIVSASSDTLPAERSTQPDNQLILILGDSLSAARGIDEDQGWVELLRQRLSQNELPINVINASVSGETTGGGLLRLSQLLELHQPNFLVIELGGNDGLRGSSTSTLTQNLQDMVTLAQKAKANTLLLGMKIPPNYGARYGRMFEQSFADVANEHQLAFVPFFLDKVALDATLMQTDQIHPTAEAQNIMLDNVWPVLVGLIQQ